MAKTINDFEVRIRYLLMTGFFPSQTINTSHAEDNLQNQSLTKYKGLQN